MPPVTDHPPAGLWRRLAAFAYDSLIVIALFVVPTSGVMAIRGGEPIPPGSMLFQLLLITTAAVFFVGFWVRGGQTLGMRAWRLRLEGRGGEPITARIGLVRFLGGAVSIGALGLGVLWVVIDPQQLTWADRLAGTRVVVLPKSQSPKRNA
jgi:uncharacterized RDD family membrane protein YckC